MKQIPLLQGKALLIELPEGQQPMGLWRIEPNRLFYVDQNGCDTNMVLPEGNWRIIGMLSEVTEEDAAKLVDYTGWGGGPDYWQDYTRPKGDCKTAIESLESAILAEGYTFQSTPKPENKDFYWGYLDDLAKWETAQPRVLDRSRCLLLGREGL